MINKTLLEKYAELKKAESEIAKQIKEIKDDIFNELVNSGQEEVTVTGCGKFTFGSRKSYNYPAEVSALEEEWKQRKLDCEREGRATYSESKYVIFYPEKE